MFCFKCQSDIAVRVMLILFVASALNIPVNGQITYRGDLVTIQGGAISPQLTGMVLEVLFDGVADLYYSDDNGKGYYYITDKAGRLFTLSASPGKRSGDEDARKLWLEGIISVLKVVMKDAPSLSGRIESIIPKKFELTKLMEDYHALVALSNEFVIYKSPPPVFLPHVGIFAGGNADLLKPQNQGTLGGYKMDTSYFPTAGISLMATLPRINEKLSLTVNLGAGKRYFYGFYHSANVPLPMTELYHECHMHNFLISGDVLIGYIFGSGHIKPSISGGVSTRSILSDKSRIESDVCYTSLVVSETNEYITTEKSSLGLTFSLGFSYEISDKVSMTTTVNYTDFLITGMPGTYRSAGLKIGANFQ